MKTYTVLIEETSSKTVEVEAESRDEAWDMVSNDWSDEKYVLDSSDFSNMFNSLF
jgi:hypothetical protein